MVKLMLLVGLGGFIGTILRFLVARFFMTSFDSVFPWGTFVVNILGSLLIGIFSGFVRKRQSHVTGMEPLSDCRHLRRIYYLFFIFK